MPNRSRIPLVFTVQWPTATDVTNDLHAFNVQHGSNHVNPDRPNIETARGYIDLVGNQYRPGQPDALFDEATLRRPTQIAVMQGEELAWRGFLSSPETIGPNLTRYRLSSRLSANARKRVEYAHSTTMFPTASTWTNLLGQAPQLKGTSDIGITFDGFTFKGPVFELVSRFAVLLGRLAGEDRQGRPVLPVYARAVPTDIIELISDRSLRLGVPNTEIVEQSIRNRIFLAFEEQGAVTSRSVDGTVSQGGEIFSSSTRLNTSFSVDIPINAPAGHSVSDVSVSLVSAFARFVGTFQTVRRTGPDAMVASTFQDIEWTEHVTISHTTSGNTVRVRFTLSPPMSQAVAAREGRRTIRRTATAPYSLISRERSVFGSTMPGALGVADFGDLVVARIWEFVATARVSYRVTAPSIPDNRVIVAQDSINQWGERTLDVPLWLTSAGLAAGQSNRTRLQTDLQHLATPRTYHRLRISLWQSTKEQNAAVARLDVGSYIHLVAQDPAENVNINAVCVVTLRRVGQSVAVAPLVELEVLETGIPVGARVSGWDAGFDAGYR